MYTVIMKKLTSLLLVLIIIFSFNTKIDANNLFDYFSTYPYSKEVILNEKQIVDFNLQINDTLSSVNNSILDFSKITPLKLQSLIYSISKKPTYKRYSSNHELLDDLYYTNLFKNIDIQTEHNIKYGIVTKRTHLKTFPTHDKVYSSITSTYDRFLESTLYLGEPLTILHESLDKNWYFISMYNYMGWVNKADIAISNKQVIKMYTTCPNVITITSKNTLSVNSHKQLDLGSNIPLISIAKNYDLVGLIPARNSNGSLYFIKDNINRIDCYKGFMPYTIDNTINIALKLINEPYGWGGANNSRDCSSYAMDIYRVFGIKLPRNTDQQELIPGTSTTITSLTNFNNLPIGSLLFMNGHVMIYLGTHNNKSYIIHDTPGFYENGKFINANGVTISTLDIYNSKAIKYVDLIYKAITIK